MEKLNNLSLPVAILISSVILGAFSYAIFERQLEIQQDTKALQDAKEYIGKRKIECYEILEKERKQFGNAVNVKYFEPNSNPYEDLDHNDSCVVEYLDKETGKSFFKSY
jgi:hypothetical protein